MADMKKRRFISLSVTCVFWIAVWQVLAMIIGQKLILVSPLKVAFRISELITDITFYKSIITSSMRIITGFILGLTVGLLLAVICAKSEKMHTLLTPFISTVKAVPVASFTILALFFLPSRELSTLVTFLIALPVVYSNLLTGILAADKELAEMATLFRISPIKKIVYISFSQLLPYFKSASSTAAGLSWKSGVAAELIVIASGSIGEKLYDSKIGFEMVDLFAWTAVVIILSFLTEFIFNKLIDGIWYIIQKI